MHFLESVRITCGTCKGERYAPEVLNLKYKGKNISEVLKITASEASDALRFPGALQAKGRLPVQGAQE